MLKMKPITNLLVAGLLLCFSQLFAQMTTTLSPQTISGAIGTTVDLQLKVTNFTNVITFQAPITYSNTVLQYLSADGFGLPGMTASNVSNPATGIPRVVVSYFPDPIAYPNGVSVTNGTALLTLHFKVLASGTATVNLATGVPPGIEVINNMGNNVTVNFQTGGTTVTGGNGGPPPLVGFKIIATADTVCPGESFCLPVKVNDFDKITLMQYAMHWDPTVLQYESVSGFNLPDLTASSFAGNGAMGVKTMIWFDPSANLSGVDRPDLATIYNVCFKAIGAANTSTNIYFDGNGFPVGSGGAEAYSAVTGNTNLFAIPANVSVPAITRIICTTPPVVAPKIIVDTTSTNINTTKCVDIRVKTFTDVASLQFGLTYDATKLTYQSVQLGANPLGLLATDITSTTAGEVKFVWNANLTTNPQGVDLADNTSIFQACFLATGAVGTVNNITPAALATLPLKAQIRVAGANVDATPTTQNGYIRIKAAPPANALMFTVDTISTVTGTSVCLSVKVNNFTNIESMQFGITYDQTKLQWQAPNFVPNPLSLGFSNFQNNATLGQVRFSWLVPDPIATPSITLPNGTKIFSICFNVIGAAGMNVPINIQAFNLYPIEISQITGTQSNTITPFIQNGFVNIIAAPTCSVVVDSTKNVSCNNGSNGAIFITAKNCTATAYSWTGPNNYTSTQADITGVKSGAYTVTVTFTGGVTATATATLTQPIPMSLPVVTPTSVTCFGGLNGSITVSPSGGTTPYNYAWSGPGGFTTSNSASISNLKAGNYVITVTDANNCTIASGQILVSQPNQITIPGSAMNVTPVSCSGTANGAITVVPSGGNAPFTYVWASTASQFTSTNAATITGLKIGSYTVTATDAGGCTGVSPAIVVGAGPSSVAVPVSNNTPVACGSVGTGALTVAPTGGSAPYSYVWTSNAAGFTSTNSATISNLKIGTYNVTATDANGCTGASATITIGLSSNTMSLPTVNITPVTCFGGSNGAITVAPVGGVTPYSYTWSGPGLFVTVNSPTITNLGSGNYTVIVSDANSCTFVSGPILTPTESNAIIIPTNTLAVTQISCAGGANGSISLSPIGGTPYSAPSNAYTYNWSGPGGVTYTQAPPLTGLGAGLYKVTATDSKGCKGSLASPIQINAAPAQLLANATDSENVKCLNDQNGSITLNVQGGTTSYTYAWKNASSPSNPVISTLQNPANLGAGSYNVVVTDLYGCTSTLASPVTINKPNSALSAALASKIDVKCHGSNTGAINISAQGGWGTPVFTWSPSGNTGANLTGLLAGIYTPTIVDAGGCVVSTPSITITEPQPISLSTVSVTNNKCVGQGDGSITIQVGGGTPVYNVNWTPGGLSGTTISNLAGGNYTPTVTDANNCTKVGNPITVTEPQNPLQLGTPVIVNQIGTSLGSITLSPAGGTSPYQYIWSHLPNPTTNSTLTGLVAGDYLVTVKDANGCITSSNAISVVNTNVLFATFIDNTPSCGDGACVRIFVNPVTSVINKPYKITWTPGNGAYTETNTALDTIKICNLVGGVYSFTVTDALGNVFVIPTTVFIQNLPPINYTATVSNPNEDFANGCITITPSSPSANYSYNWSSSLLDTNSICSLDSGLYKITITDLETGCTKKDMWHLTRVWQPVGLNLVSEKPSCTASENGKITALANGGNPPYSYNWVGTSIAANDTTNVVDLLKQGLYSVTVTDENGTTVVAQVTLLAKSNLTATALNVPQPNGDGVSGAGICDGEVQVTQSGGVAPINYTWNNSVTTATNITLCAGDWNVVVTDVEGCTVALNGVLTSPGAITINSSCEDKNGFCVTCNGDKDGVAKVSVVGGIAPYEVKWSTGFTQTLTNSSQESVQPGLKAGDYGVTITDNNGVVVTKVVVVTEPKPLEIAFTGEKPTRFTNCDAYSVATLVSGTGAQGVATYTWSTKFGSGTGQQAEDLCAGQVVQFLVQDANGCTASATDTIDFPDDGCLIFRPVLTPGTQDEKNDYLLVTCVEFVPNNTMEIYNRWGQLVFETTGYNNETNNWKGTNSQNQALPEGVYFYVFKYVNGSTNESVVSKGYINILR
jgi:gliding motility-associated-like protein